jgi:glyoxylase-like metal-dependent hydrolase (beta-lactamase superfamily II)
MTAELQVLVDGYVGERVGSSVSLIIDGEAVIVVDPGMVSSRARILEPLAARGLDQGSVTDVVFSHHHPDHTLNAALFPEARFHDFMAIYQDDIWEDRDAEGFALGGSTHLLATPGHTDQDISTAVATEDGLVVLTHLWWTAAGPLEDPFAPDAEVLKASRDRVLSMEPALIVPGHGARFVPGSDTPR